MGKNYIIRFDLTTSMIDGCQVNTVIYTDGSCSEGTKGSGLVSVVTNGTAAKSVVIEIITKKGVNTHARMKRKHYNGCLYTRNLMTPSFIQTVSPS